MSCAGACNCGPCVVGRRGADNAVYVGDGRAWSFRQLGQLEELPPGGVEDQPCPPGWPAGFPCVVPGPGEFPGLPTPGGVPGPTMIPTVVITEDEARERERAAYARGSEEERSSFIKYTIIGSVISGVVGYGIAKVLG